MGLAISERSFKSIKTIIPSYLPGHWECKNLCFVSVTQRVRVSSAFVYNVVDINKLATFPLVKPLPNMNAQYT